MSMISDLADRLRVESKSMGKYGVDYMATLLMQASDTIIMLSEKARADRPSASDIMSAYHEGVRKGIAEAFEAGRPQGEWIYCEDYVGHDGYECSNCGFFIPWAYDCYTDSNFILNYHTCPHCDAKMKGAGDDTI